MKIEKLGIKFKTMNIDYNYLLDSAYEILNNKNISEVYYYDEISKFADIEGLSMKELESLLNFYLNLKKGDPEVEILEKMLSIIKNN